MADYDVGYGKPPHTTQFKPGKSGNPKGRPKRDQSLLGDVVNHVLDEPVQYREKGRAQTATRREVSLTILVQRAIKGDVAAADMVLRKRARALRRAGGGVNRLQVRDWLPDYPGQTADQKARDIGSSENQIIIGEHACSSVGLQSETEGSLDNDDVTEAADGVAK
jgi:hypothetical protein